MDARELLQRYLRAHADHDIDAAMECWHPDAEGIHPLRPDRSWYGRDACREIWVGIWERHPVSRLRVVSSGIEDNRIYLETMMDFGDGTAIPGINVLEVEDGRFRHLRVYTDVPTNDGVGIDKFLHELDK